MTRSNSEETLMLYESCRHVLEKKKKQQQFDGMEWDKRWSQRCCSVHRGTEHGAAWAAAHFMNVRIETLMSRRQEDR